MPRPRRVNVVRTHRGGFERVESRVNELKKGSAMPICGEAQTRLPLYFSRKGREKAECTAFAQGHILHVPLISDALAQIECLTTQIQMSGDHAIVVGLVEGAQTPHGKTTSVLRRKIRLFRPLIGSISHSRLGH